MQYESINTSDELQDYCRELAKHQVIAFDTEFVSEDRYRPQLCLLQVSAGGKHAIIDPMPMGKTQAFWNLLTQKGRTIVAHAAREEIRFCYRFTGKPIAGLFDTQLAAGFVGMEYPASLRTLVQKIAGKTLPKGETRTNWRHRPLTQAQLNYAVHDVVDLESMHEMLSKEIDSLNRRVWLDEETASLQQKVIDGETQERWRRVAGASGLNPRQLEVVKHVWRWREDRAKRTDRLPKRVMRDDLLVELAKRGSHDAEKIRHIRGLDHRGFQDHYKDIAAAIRQGHATPDEELPRRSRGTRSAASPMLSQFLSTSIACISRQQKLAPPDRRQCRRRSRVARLRTGPQATRSNPGTIAGLARRNRWCFVPQNLARGTGDPCRRRQRDPTARIYRAGGGK